VQEQPRGRLEVPERLAQQPEPPLAQQEQQVPEHA
jgi:hypothetical protein